jgi:hypothetical protein
MTERKIVGRSKITRKADIINALLNWDKIEHLNSEVKKAIISGKLNPPKYIAWRETEYKVKYGTVENWYAVSTQGQEIVLPRMTATVKDYRGMCARIIMKNSKFYNAVTSFQAVDRMVAQVGDYKVVYQNLLNQAIA